MIRDRHWCFCHNLRPPSSNYDLTTWTDAGKCKAKEGSGSFIPGEDFVPSVAVFAQSTHLFLLASSEEVFSGAPRVWYEKLRNACIIVKREKPVVPCPSQTVLPTRRMSKHQRAKLCNIYLRPWTLHARLRDEEVPFAGDFVLSTAESIGQVRAQWKTYLAGVLPHAKDTIRNFIANSWAESHRDEDEDAVQSGPAMTCNLTHADVAKVLAGDRQPAKAGANEKKLAVVEMVARSTDVAMNLCRMHARTEDFLAPRLGLVLQRQQSVQVVAHTVPQEEQGANIQVQGQCDVGVETRDWSAIAEAYDAWYADVFLDRRSKVPTEQQAVVLDLVHKRRKLEYFLEQELTLEIELQDLSPEPLYRLIHGLPGAGKSQVLLWIRSYFEVVWQWQHGDQFVFLALRIREYGGQGTTENVKRR